MAKVLVLYYSRTKNTMRMAEMLGEAVKDTGHEAVVKPVKEADIDDLPDYDAYLLGSPTYYGTLAGPMKDFLDRSVKYHGKLAGRMGGAFSSSANTGGGNETTIMSLLQALLIHGMAVMGDHEGDHYGPVSIGPPDDRAAGECARYGEKFGQFLSRLHPKTEAE